MQLHYQNEWRVDDQSIASTDLVSRFRGGGTTFWFPDWVIFTTAFPPVFAAAVWAMLDRAGILRAIIIP